MIQRLLHRHLTLAPLFIVCSLLLASLAHAVPLKPEPMHKATTLEIISNLHRRHFSSQRIDDTLSQKFLSNYLTAIDKNRQSFLQEEVDAFTKSYGNELDDDLKKGDVSPAYSIFNLYRERMIKRLQAQ